LRDLLAPCRLCPNRCGVDRIRGETGRCGIAAGARIASFGPHYGEEGPLVGTRGSGTVFFSGCNLSCRFCQNAAITQDREGDDVSAAELGVVFLRLQRAGCHNLNLVTPTHQAHVIVEALAKAVDHGFGLPVVWNCGGHESLEALEILEGTVDIYMPDLKYGSDEVGRELSGVDRYVETSQAAVVEMHRQVGDLEMGEDGVTRRGLLVRHLVLPEDLAGTLAVATFLARDVSVDTYVNVMDQYHPCYRASETPALRRRVTADEIRRAMSCARAAGLHRFAAPDGR